MKNYAVSNEIRMRIMRRVVDRGIDGVIFPGFCVWDSSNVKQYGTILTGQYQGGSIHAIRFFAQITIDTMTGKYNVKITSTNEIGKRRMDLEARDYVRQAIWNSLNTN